jgi:A/G-specific adenine glycosylase
MPPSTLHAPLLDWYTAAARDLPWRAPGAGAWSVLVSAFMLQQTPVARVLPVHTAWLERWPTPADLAAAAPGDAVRAWGRLGYPRRALRLHQAATAIADQHGGAVPSSYEELLALPGVGTYTAAAVATFAFGQRYAVLDTNVRRVLARVTTAQEHPGPSVTVGEARAAEALLPDDPPVAARWSVAVMELGALVCTAGTPRCTACPLAAECEWNRAGRPGGGARPRAQTYAGTDRQVRGRLLAVLRESDDPVPAADLAAVWDDADQRERALAGLLADGLAERTTGDRYRLPGRVPAAG